MKRLTLLIVLLVALGVASGFALEVKPTFTLSGSATLTWGLNLDTMDTGFKNAGSADLSVFLVADGQSDTHAGKGDLYGSITISDLELYWIDGLEYSGADVTGAGGAQPSISAKLVFGSFELGVNGAPAMSSGATTAIENAPDTGNATVNAILQSEPTFTFGAYGSSQGTYLKYLMGSNWVAVDVVSQDAWDNAATKSNYALGAEASMTFAPVAVAVGVFQGINYAANPLGGYVKPTLTLEGIGSASVGLDWQYAAATFGWDLSANVQMNFNKDATAYLVGKVFYNPTGTNLDSAVTLMIPVDTLLGKINADATLYMVDLASPVQSIGLLAHFGYAMSMSNGMLVAPTLEVGFTNVGAANALNLHPQVVVTLAKAPDTTLTFSYDSGNLLAAAPGKGNFTTALKVKY